MPDRLLPSIYRPINIVSKPFVIFFLTCYGIFMGNDTRERMLESTARLLQHRGYYGTSLNDILAASGAPRGSLYFHFPGGKDQLVVEATRATVGLATAELHSALQGAPSPGKGVRRYAEAAAELMCESDFTFGCPVAPVILDATGDVSELAALCRQALDDWTDAIRDGLRAAGHGRARADRLAIMAIAAIEGALVIARARRDESALRQVGEELERLLDGDLPAASPRGGRRRR
jgi:TetR/AcrR family transcriptional repressor of lmrAB and yxaGH operons